MKIVYAFTEKRDQVQKGGMSKPPRGHLWGVVVEGIIEMIRLRILLTFDFMCFRVFFLFEKKLSE